MYSLGLTSSGWTEKQKKWMREGRSLTSDQQGSWVQNCFHKPATSTASINLLPRKTLPIHIKAVYPILAAFLNPPAPPLVISQWSALHYTSYPGLFWGLAYLYTQVPTPPYCIEISPTRCNNCVFILRSGFTLHVSGDNLAHRQEYICRIWPQVSRLT